MKKTCSFFIFCVLVFLGLSSFAIAQELQQDQQADLNRLQKLDPALEVRWDEKTVTPVHLRGKLSEPLEGTAKEMAVRFLADNRNLFRIKDVQAELFVIGEKSDDLGWQHVSLQQMYLGVPVESKTILVHINPEKEVRSVLAHYLPGIDLDVTPKVSREKAIEAAKAHLQAEKGLPEEPKAKLVVYNRYDKTFLAWKIGLFSEEPLGDYDYFIDAHTGKFIHRLSKLKEARDRKTYTANNGTTLPGTLVISEGGTSTDNVVQDAHNNMGLVYQYYNNVHGRDSWDDAGITIVTTVHYKNNYNNAFWSPSREQFVFGDGDGNRYDPLGGGYDIVVHEFTHAITDTTAKFIYERQSGALHESFSDVFACFVDPDWMIGEDVFTPGTAGDASRYLDDPTQGGQPDHMNNFDSYPPGTSCGDLNDNCGVHTNSGIPNKAAFILIAGDTHHGISVCGIGRTAAEKIYYRALTVELWNTPNASFMDARDALMNATAALYPGDLQKYISVQNAFAAVGIGTPYSGLAICLTPTSLSVAEGSNKTVSALVTDNGAAASGVTVNFSIANTALATVSPPSGTTGPDGNITCTVSGIAKGNTILTATGISGSQAASGNIAVKVYEPCRCACNTASAGTRKQVAWVMLLPLLGIAIWRYKIRQKRK